MMGKGKEIPDTSELYIVTVVFITSYKLVRNEHISLGNLGLMKTLKMLLAALELLSPAVCSGGSLILQGAPSLKTAAFRKALSSHNSTEINQTCRESPPLKNQDVGVEGTQQVWG